MANNVEIPTQAGRPFSERVMLPDGNTYTLILKWNKRAQCWCLDILDSIGQYKYMSGIPLVTGCDLLEQFLYFSFGVNTFWTVMTIGPGEPPDQVPTFWNLGGDGHLFLASP